MKPEIMWAFWAKRSGPFFKLPQRVICYGKSSYDFWWHRNGNYSITKQGLYIDNNYISFAHPDKKEVQKFIVGFNACRGLFFNEK